MKIVMIAAIAAASVATQATAQSLRRADQQERGGLQVAPMATTDPFKVIYRVPGVRDSGAASGQGTATVFMCSNFSQTTESIRITIRNWSSNVAGVRTYQLGTRRTATVSTHYVNSFYSDYEFLLGSGGVNQGLATIESTSTNAHCSAMIVDASLANGNGVALHMVRFNPHPGSVE